MGNINDHRIDITGQDWSGTFRADGDYIAWRHVEPIVEANKTLLEALEKLTEAMLQAMIEENWGKGMYDGVLRGEAFRTAQSIIAKVKGETP